MPTNSSLGLCATDSLCVVWLDCSEVFVARLCCDLMDVKEFPPDTGLVTEPLIDHWYDGGGSVGPGIYCDIAPI